MNYNISSVSKLLGFSNQALRYFEDNNLISPSRDTQSNYRQYHPWDIGVLLRLRNYRSCGYSLSEIKDIMQYKNSKEMSATYKVRAEEILEQIAWNEAVAKYLAAKAELIFAVEDMLNIIKDVNSPSIYRISYMYRNHIRKEVDIILGAWVEKMPFVQSFPMHRHPDLKNGIYGNIDTGLGIFEEHIDLFSTESLYLNDYVTYYPATRCIETIRKISQTDTDILFDPMLNYLKENKLQINGDVLWMPLFSLQEDNNAVTYYRVWMPVA